MEQLEKKKRKNEDKNKNIVVLYVLLLITAFISLSVFYFINNSNRPIETNIATYNFSLGVWPEGCTGTASINKEEEIWSLQFDQANQTFLTEPISGFNKIKIKIFYSGFLVVGDNSFFTGEDVFKLDALDEQNAILKSRSFSEVSIDTATTIIIEHNNINRLKLTLTNYVSVDHQNLIASNVLISKIQLDSIS